MQTVLFSRLLSRLGKLALLGFFLLAATITWAQTPGNPLSAGFQTPPTAAKPRVWWHWMNGNITQEGIAKDLDWMSRVGIGGFQNFDANLFTPVIVPKKLVYMTPEWKAAFKFATETAIQKNLEMAIAGSPGWSVTGGPWVQPEDGMKKYVWTETQVNGGKIFNEKLPKPAETTGAFQHVGIGAAAFGGPAPTLPTYYADAAVIAYKLPAQERRLQVLSPKLSTSGGSFKLEDLTDGNLLNSTELPPQAIGEDMWIQYEFASPQTFMALTLVGASHLPLEEFNGGPLNRSLKVSDDGVVFREVARVSSSIVPQNTVSFPATTARFFRICFKTLEPVANPMLAMFGVVPDPKPEGVKVAEFVLHNTSRMDQFEDKAGFSPWKEDATLVIQTASDAIPLNSIVDLSAKMKSDGNLDWEVPPGQWAIIRLGYSLTGRQNHPASPEATGLEVDKLDPIAVRKYINNYLDQYQDATGGLMGTKGLQYMILDSYEAGHMTWTKNFPAEFAKRRGYAIQPWIPVLTGRVIQSMESSEKFLWDFRKTIGELITEYHYEVIGEELHKRGLKRYTESHENQRIFLADGMDVKRKADVPMSAMWTPGSLAAGSDEEVRSEADIRESAAVAHIYGQNIVAAESMTAVGRGFVYAPQQLKRTADLEMASGLNRFVIHTSVHQPLDDKMPGFSLGPFGQWFTRQETWAEQAKAWMDYLGRSCHLLQQGRFVADVLYYYGENNNITSTFSQKLPAVPTGYAFDFANASALINAIQVKNGLLTASSGNTYRLLVLDESARWMTLATLKRLRDLIKAGAKVSGVKPEKSPSLSDDPAEFQKVLADAWSSPNVLKGSMSEVLKKLQVAEDLVITGNQAKILYVHRKTANADIYWLNNRSENVNEASISFRVSGKVPELWNPQTGKIEKVSYQIKNGRTIIPLRFESWDAFFIVFGQKTSVLAYSKSVLQEKTIAEITSPWQVDFQAKRGAPAQATFSQLNSWHENADPGIKYFSGAATYQNTFNITTLKKGGKYELDLGEVKELAEVTLNGKSLGVIWKKPFVIDISNAIQGGNNTLEIKVVNPWVNRLIGDAQPGAQKITFTTMPFYQANAPLMPAGLLGPVRIVEKTI